MTKEVIQTNEAPAAIGPYSQAVRKNGVLYVSGQIPLCPKTAEMVADDVETQTRQVLENLDAVLRAAGCGREDVLKVTIYVADLADFAAVNAIYGAFFSEPFPARACIQAAALPKNARVEMDAIAVCP